MAAIWLPAAPEDLGATLVLVRHGESTWTARGLVQGRQDPPLSKRGRAQASLVTAALTDASRPPAAAIPDRPPHAIWHSPLRRAAATARAIVASEVAAGRWSRDGTAPRVVAERRLAEIGYGVWEGRTLAAVARAGPELAGWRADPLGVVAPGGEPLPDVQARVGAVLRELLGDLAARAGSRPRSSAGPLAADDRAASDRPWALVVAHDGTLRVALLTLLDLPLARFWAFPFAHCAITVVEILGGRAALRLHNLARHLEADGPQGA